jgi:hypothetical protein
MVGVTPLLLEVDDEDDVVVPEDDEVEDVVLLLDASCPASTLASGSPPADVVDDADEDDDAEPDDESPDDPDDVDVPGFNIGDDASAVSSSRSPTPVSAVHAHRPPAARAVRIPLCRHFTSSV